MARTSSSRKTASGPSPGSRSRGHLRVNAVRKFLAQYKEAWESKNADLAASLFTRDAHYWENPFGKAIVGREAIHAYWEAATREQQDIQFAVKSSFHQKYTLVAEWICSYTHRPSGEHHELAGMMFADFYGGQVRTFREYWHRRTK